MLVWGTYWGTIPQILLLPTQTLQPFEISQNALVPAHVMALTLSRRVALQECFRPISATWSVRMMRGAVHESGRSTVGAAFLPSGLQPHAQTQGAERRHALRMHLQNLDIRARAVHPRPYPPDAGTEHLAGCRDSRCSSSFEDWQTPGLLKNTA